MEQDRPEQTKIDQDRPRPIRTEQDISGQPRTEQTHCRKNDILCLGSTKTVTCLIFSALFPSYLAILMISIYLVIIHCLSYWSRQFYQNTEDRDLGRQIATWYGPKNEEKEVPVVAQSQKHRDPFAHSVIGTQWGRREEVRISDNSVM